MLMTFIFLTKDFSSRLLLGGGRQPGLHKAVAEVDLVKVHLGAGCV